MRPNLHLPFQKFNEVIDSSRAEAERAEANIPEIERLINSANNKSDEASGTLGDAQESAEKAQSTAERAQDTAERTREVKLKNQLSRLSVLNPKLPTFDNEPNRKDSLDLIKFLYFGPTTFWGLKGKRTNTTPDILC